MSRNGWGTLGNGIVAYVLGDSMSDVYQSVKVTKIAPDVPAPVWEIDGEPVYCAGGSANVAEQLRYLSADVTLAHLCGAPGNSTHERKSGRLKYLSRAGIRNIKTRYVAGGHVLARLDDFAAGERLTRMHNVTGLLDEIKNDLDFRGVKDGATADGKRVVAVCSDYAAGFWQPQTAIRAVALFHLYGVPVVVDPKPPRLVKGERMGVELEHWQGAAVVKLNDAEARSFSGVAESLPLAQHVRECFGASDTTTVVTRGPLPPLVCGRGEFPPEAHPFGSDLGTDRPLWASGAGDCFAAYLAASVAECGRATVAGVARAHAAGAVYTTKRYNEPVHPREAMERAGYRGAKLYTDPRELASRISALPAGAKIGYTNGVFDLLHAGHISGLAWARKRCDFLAVFVNSDSSVMSLRGTNPVLWFGERAAALAGLSCVDAVIGFNEIDPRKVFAQVGMCETLFKGEEYRGEELRGQEFAANVEFVPEEFKLHSAAIRERAAKAHEASKLVNRGRKEGDS